MQRSREQQGEEKRRIYRFFQDVMDLQHEQNHTVTMPASLHRKKLFGLFENQQKCIVYLKGGELMYRHDTDYEFPFRQESNFWYLTGVDKPDYDMILDLNRQEFHLFKPHRDAHFAVWHGHIRSDDEIREEYCPDFLHDENDLLSVIRQLKPDLVYCLNEEQAEFLEDLDRTIPVDTESLMDAVTYCRCIKTEWELNQMREAARINNLAHTEVLKNLKPDRYEYEMKAVFDYHQILHGLLIEAYTGIHASGPNSAILHYVDNKRKMRDGDLYLIDAGFEMNGYASDFSRTYPVNGTFSGDQAVLYQTVLEAQKNCIQAAGPGVRMEDLHMLAARTILEGLREFGIVKGSMDDLLENNIFALFFPHGLGHFLGLDTHDVGGYPKGVDKIERPGLQFLRARRELLPGMVITVEPGLYFIPALLIPAMEDSEKKRFLQVDRIRKLLDFGGIRIEDNLIITDDGVENLTRVPREITEIESVMKEVAR